MIKKLSAALVGATFVLAGCNTMSGMGQDMVLQPASTKVAPTRAALSFLIMFLSP